jgi:hypothetical protein
MQSMVLSLLDSTLVLAGHGYDFRSSPGGESPADDDGGGLGAEWIVAVLLLTVVAVVVLTWLGRQDREPGGEPRARALKPKSVAPVTFIVAVIAAPLVVWTTSSGGEEKSLMVERWTSVTGEPELLVSLSDDLNVRANPGKRVRLRCRGRQEQVVLDVSQKWPFIKERGYEFPHAHQAATPEQVQRADECTLRGAGLSLEAEVEGALKD